MKIGIDIRLIGKNRTGDEVVFFNLVKNLAEIDSENEYVLFTDVVNEKVMEKIKSSLGISGKNNISVVSLETTNKFLWNLFVLPSYLKNNPVDVYLTQYITPFFVSKKIKIMTIIHDISFERFPQYIRKSDLFFLKTLIPLSIRRADKVIGVSQFTKNEIIEKYNVAENKVVFMHNAISDQFVEFDISDKIKNEVRTKYQLPPKYILYMGTLQPRKNIPNLLEAYSKVKSKIPDCKMVIAGNKNGHNFDTLIDTYITKYKLSRDVIFPGFIDESEKKVVYNMAHAFVMPSLYEGFGIPVLEAMSQKVPVIASDIPSLKEVAGESALFFSVNEVDDLAEKLYTICEDKTIREKLIQSGLRRVSFFSWKKSARLILDFCKELVHNR